MAALRPPSHQHPPLRFARRDQSARRVRNRAGPAVQSALSDSLEGPATAIREREGAPSAAPNSLFSPDLFPEPLSVPHRRLLLPALLRLRRELATPPSAAFSAHRVPAPEPLPLVSRRAAPGPLRLQWSVSLFRVATEWSSTPPWPVRSLRSWPFPAASSATLHRVPPAAAPRWLRIAVAPQAPFHSVVAIPVEPAGWQARPPTFSSPTPHPRVDDRGPDCSIAEPPCSALPAHRLAASLVRRGLRSPSQPPDFFRDQDPQTLDFSCHRAAAHSNNLNSRTIDHRRC